VSLWLGFIAVAAVDIVTPGPAIVLAVNNGALYGPRRTLWSTLGNEMGLLGHGVVGAVGVAAAIEAMPRLFVGLELIGVAYLCWLGIARLRSNAATVNDRCSVSSSVSAANLVRTGFGTAALNPRPFLFFAALLPQFIHPEQPFALQIAAMISTFLALSFLSLSLYSMVGSRLGGLRGGERMQWALTRVSGAAFLVFAAHLAGVL